MDSIGRIYQYSAQRAVTCGGFPPGSSSWAVRRLENNILRVSPSEQIRWHLCNTESLVGTSLSYRGLYSIMIGQFRANQRVVPNEELKERLWLSLQLNSYVQSSLAKNSISFLQQRLLRPPHPPIVKELGNGWSMMTSTIFER